MDLNFDNIGVVNTGYTPDQLEAIELSDKIINEALNDVERVREMPPRPTVPIYELKADEEARAKLRNHKEEEEYEELVKAVKEVKAYLTDKPEIFHKALAVELDDEIMFDELKRSHKLLDNTYAYITKETNKWEEHEAMYDALLANIRDESDKCEEARQMLSKLM